MGRDEREAAYVEFVASRQAHFRRIAYALCGNWSQADDLLQVALVKLYVAWPRVKRDGREEAYVRRILVRANIDESRRPWRREHLVGTLPDCADPPTPDTDHGQLLEAVLGLPLMQRRTVVLRHWLGLSVEETAAELGVASGTVKTHSARALERLQVALTKEGS